MHLPSGLTPLVAFLALLAKATAQDSAPFELASHVIEPTNNALNGLYLTAFSYHPGGFFYATLAQPTEENPALVSVLTGPAGNQTLETSSIEGFSPLYIAIGAGSTNAPAAFDSVQLYLDDETTFGLQFVSDDVGDILTWSGVAGDWYSCLQNPAEPPNLETPPAGVYRLFYIPAGNETPTGCSTLQLVREPTS